MAATEAMKAEEGNTTVEERMRAAEQLKDQVLQFIVDFVPDNIFAALERRRAMLQVIFFEYFFGIMLLLMPQEKSNPSLTWWNSINEVFLKMVEVVMEAALFFLPSWQE